MSAGKQVKVLVVDDSAVGRELLVHILHGDPSIRVIGTAANGLQALQEVERLRPDVITMDIVMPQMDGLEATRRIMAKAPLPIIIVSGTVNRREVSTTFEALKAGAVAAIPRPGGPGTPDYAVAARELNRTVKAMAEVRLVRRWSDAVSAAAGVPVPDPPVGRKAEVVAIGASTGGPEALRRILELLPADFPLPVLVAQHMAAGFLDGLAQWLDRASPLAVRLSFEGEAIRPGQVYIAPDDRHLGISQDRRLVLSDAAPEKGVRPAVGFLFRSVQQRYCSQAIAILLTGMGDDGAREMLQLRQAGAVTIAQDRESSVIHGMPGEAVRLGAALHQLPPAQIAHYLREAIKGQGR
ncbi:MAG: chemotaxis-specific protein-glutamate methyltransferase CheB [Desulfuromonadales bacterium]|nr:chemotaxis-specific protein-glutamate methyltransferase CheB [Desulfuromonadales bacterium]